MARGLIVSGRIISEEIITKTTATVNAPKRAAATVARSQTFVEFMGIMNGRIAPSIRMAIITKAAMAAAAAMATGIEVAVVILIEAEGMKMIIREMDPMIGVKIGTKREIEAKSTALSVRIPWWNPVT